MAPHLGVYETETRPKSSHSLAVTENQLWVFFFGIVTRWTRPRLCSRRSFNWATISSTASVTALRFPCRQPLMVLVPWVIT